LKDVLNTIKEISINCEQFVDFKNFQELKGFTMNTNRELLETVNNIRVETEY